MIESVDVAVVGGGFTGLVAAFHLRRAAGLRTVLLEATGQAGGKVRTGTLAGLPVEEGPDAFLARGSTIPALCGDLGLQGLLVRPVADRACVWSRGRARTIPSGLLFGMPSRPLALARSGILSAPGALRAALDLVLPASPVTPSTTVADLTERRFGREARERLVDAMVGGIYAGDTSALGLADALPELYRAASAGRSLLLASRGRPKPSGSPFQTLRGGLQQLPESLAAGLDVRVQSPVTEIRKLPGGGFEVVSPAGTLAARAVVVTTPAFVAARILDPLDGALAGLLGGIRYAGVATIGLAYPGEDLQPSGTSGFLVPPREGRLVTAVTWTSEKWPHPGDVALVRCSVGRSGDQRWRKMDDRTLIGIVRDDLATLAGVTAEPEDVRVTRWQAALPQYEPGHLARVDDIEARLARHPGLLLAGAGYRGVGLTACAAQAERAAARAAELCGKATAA